MTSCHLCLHPAAAAVSQTVLSYRLVLPVLVYLPGLHSLASGSAAALFQTAPSSHVVLMLQVGSAARLVGSVAALCQSVSLSRQPAVLVACPNSLTAVVAVNVC